MNTNFIHHNNYKIAYRTWNEYDPKKPTLVFAHASGFHSMIWNKIIQKLSPYHCIAIDFSGHGLSDNPDVDYKWNQFSNELKSLIIELNLNNIIGIGHSLGAYAITHSTATLNERYDGLILFDPSIFTKDKYLKKVSKNISAQGFDKSKPHPISKRNNVWKSKNEMYNRFKDRYPFTYWDKSVLLDYCDFGLNYNSVDKIFNLSCPPWAEGRMMYGSAEYGIFDIINSFQKNVLIIRSGGIKANKNEDLFSRSVTDPDLHKMFLKSKDILIEEVTHFIPQEKTEQCAKIINNYLKNFY